jgi:hypothetical protein
VLNVGQKIIRLNYYHEVIKTQIQIAAFSTWLPVALLYYILNFQYVLLILLYIENKSQEGKDKGLISGIRILEELYEILLFFSSMWKF